MNIITGSKGEPHITPIQDAMWHRGITEEPSGVFNAGSKFQPTKLNNNQVKISDGVLSIQGRFVIIEPKTADIVSIENGAQGMKRTDIICARIYTDFEQEPPVHNADIVVFTGEESAIEPIAPTIPERDLDSGDTEAYYPLVRVNIEGINIASVEMIGYVFTTIQDVLNSLTELLRPV